jgi:two-component system CheB/CheR fusion protein
MTLSGIRALVVDDHADTLDMVRELLEHEGAEVEVARHGGEAFTLLRNHQFDVVVSDLAMPGTSGLVLARGLRRRRDAIPALAISGHPPEFEQQAYAEGFDAFLAKPFEIEQLIGAVKKLVRRDAL